MMQLDTHELVEPFRHEAFLYSGDPEFLARTTPFILDALEADEPVLVMVGGSKIEALRAELNGHADSVFFADMAVAGENPARIIPAWKGFVSRHAATAPGLRGIGEPIWPGRTPAELDECHFHESLLNVAFGSGPPFWLLCPYDTTGLDTEVIEEANHTHPFVLDGETHRRSDAYEAPSDVASPHDGPALPAPPTDVEHRVVDGVKALPEVRGWTERFLIATTLSSDRRADFVLAVNELATNSIMHGGGAGTLRFWLDDDNVIAEVGDAGHIADPLVGRVQPAPMAQSGRGLWLANQLCELVQIRSTDAGTVVRLHMRRR